MVASLQPYTTNEICGKEIGETATTCSAKCRQKLYRQRKAQSVTKRNVTAEISLSEASRDELVTMIELMKKQLDIQQKMLDYFLSNGVGMIPVDSRQSTDNFGINPPAPKPYIPTFDDPLPIVEVKKSAKQDGNVQATNFLNSIMALNG